ncbi:MAG TPA: hypothetical protein PLO65_03370 [Caulobacter sp.]|nr:hypothetical protein [Caulobacter sp.]
MSQARFSVRTAVAEGFEFWRGNVLRAIGPLVIAAGGLVLLLTARSFAALAAGFALYGLAGLAAQAALYRISLADAGAGPATRNGPFGLQWRGLETRFVAVSLLTAALLGIVAVIAAFIIAGLLVGLIGVPAATTATTPEALLALLTPTGALIFNLAALAAMAGLLVLNARLSLAFPATAAENRVRVISSIALTRGSVLRILGATLLINLPIILMQSLAGLFGDAMRSPESSLWTQLIVGVISTFFYVPISVGMTSYIYRRLRGSAGQ